MRRHVVHELRLGSFADGQAAELPDTAFVGRFSTGQEHPDTEAHQARPAVDGGHTPTVIRRNDRPARSA